MLAKIDRHATWWRALRPARARCARARRRDANECTQYYVMHGCHNLMGGRAAAAEASMSFRLVAGRPVVAAPVEQRHAAASV